MSPRDHNRVTVSNAICYTNTYAIVYHTQQLPTSSIRLLAIAQPQSLHEIMRENPYPKQGNMVVQSTSHPLELNRDHNQSNRVFFPFLASYSGSPAHVLVCFTV
jgi:hypothetical protein